MTRLKCTLYLFIQYPEHARGKVEYRGLRELEMSTMGFQEGLGPGMVRLCFRLKGNGKGTWIEGDGVGDFGVLKSIISTLERNELFRIIIQINFFDWDQIESFFREWFNRNIDSTN